MPCWVFLSSYRLDRAIYPTDAVLLRAWWTSSVILFGGGACKRWDRCHLAFSLKTVWL